MRFLCSWTKFSSHRKWVKKSPLLTPKIVFLEKVKHLCSLSSLLAPQSALHHLSHAVSGGRDDRLSFSLGKPSTRRLTHWWLCLWAAVWGSVSCPRVPWHADRSDQTTYSPISRLRRLSYHRASNYSPRWRLSIATKSVHNPLPSLNYDEDERCGESSLIILVRKCCSRRNVMAFAWG